jgi:hypothetical protein
MLGTYGTFGGIFACRGGNMTPAAIIKRAALDGVSLALSHAGTIKASGEGEAVKRWLSTIREHKAEIVEALKVSPGDTARGWLVRYPDGSAIETYIILADGAYPTRAEVLRDYPGAIGAEALPEAEAAAL